MKKEQVGKFIIITLIVFFGALLLAEMSGYYVPETARKKALTEEQIRLFEEDIKNGKAIDISDYSSDNKMNYKTNLSDNLYKVSLKLEGAIDQVIKSMFNKAAKAINE